MAKSHGPTLLQEIERILRKFQHPLSSRMILDEVENAGNVSIKGGTPLKTINARITEDIREQGDSSAFKRVGKGVYTIRARSEDEYLPPPQQKKYPTDYEHSVLTFPSEFLNQLGYFQGVRKDYQRYYKNILGEKNNKAGAFFLNRHEAERNFSHKQVVSYVIIKHKDKILRQTRGARTSVSSYLRGSYSIGFGGHTEIRDELPLFHDVNDFGYSRSIVRELAEELNIRLPSPSKLKTIGVLNDESVQEGLKHIAFIHTLDLTTEEVEKNERWINDLQFVKIKSLNEEFEDYEYWSKLCILSFFGKHLPLSQISVKEGFSLGSQSDLILIVGYVGSGKTEACALLENEFNYTFVRCSRIMQDIIGCGPIEKIGRHQLQEEGYKFINSPGGHDQLAQGIIDYMSSHPNNRYVFDGLRYPETLAALQKRLNKPISVLYIDTMNGSLYRNQKTRDSKKFTFPEFMNTVYHPVERKIAQFRPFADITIYNHGSLKSYLNALRKFFVKEFEK